MVPLRHQHTNSDTVFFYRVSYKFVENVWAGNIKFYTFLIVELIETQIVRADRTIFNNSDNY
jgi:hypothetical protein